ncbi:MAG: hypothetical protein PHY92_10020, partial [Alphaproteobacteria bacterium]|nr:hypothetical protein [Alphaproteobacteria bacterium]
MRCFIALAAFFLLISIRPASAADTFVPGESCDTLGASHMAADNTGLVICGLTAGSVATNCASGGGCLWKTMSNSAWQCSAWSTHPNSGMDCVNVISGKVCRTTAAFPVWDCDLSSGWPGGGAWQCTAWANSYQSAQDCIRVSDGLVC